MNIELITRQPMWLFAALLLMKFFLLLAVPLPESWHGDAWDYVGKARYLYEHGTFPEIRKGPDEEEPFRTADFRPPGYHFFISVFIPLGESNAEIARSVRIAQFGLDAVTTTLLLLIAYSFHPALGYRWFAAFILGLQPWTGAFIVAIVPETLTTILTVVGVLLLSFFVTWDGALRQAMALLGASLLLSLTFIIRPEMILFTFVLLAASILYAVRSQPARNHVLFLVIAALPFLGVIGANMAYRFHAADEIAIFGARPGSSPSGLGLWTGTWIAPQTIKEEIVFGPLRIGPNRFAELPSRMFSDESERDKLLKVVSGVHARGFMNAEDDQMFLKVARERMDRDPLTYYLWQPLYAAGNSWLNLSNAAHYLYGFSHLPRPVSKLLTAAFFGFKLLVLALFLYGVYRIIVELRSRSPEQWYLLFMLLGIGLALMRTLFFSFYYRHAEYRYTTIVWPFILLVALFGVSAIWTSLTHRSGQPLVQARDPIRT